MVIAFLFSDWYCVFFRVTQVPPNNPIPSVTPIISNTAIVQVPPKTPLIPTVTVMPSPLIPTSTLIPSPTQNLIPTNDMSVVLTSTPDFFGGIDCPGAPIVKVQVND